MSATHELSRDERRAIIAERAERQYRRDAERAQEALRPVAREHSFEGRRDALRAAAIDRARRARISGAERSYLKQRAATVDHVRLEAACAERSNVLDRCKVWQDCGFWYPRIESKQLRNRATRETNASVLERIAETAVALGMVTIGSYLDAAYETDRELARINGTLNMRRYWVGLSKQYARTASKWIASRDLTGAFCLSRALSTGAGVKWERPYAPSCRPTIYSREVFFSVMPWAETDAESFCVKFVQRQLQIQNETVNQLAWKTADGQLNYVTRETACTTM